MTENDIIYEVAEKAKVLADKPVYLLRLDYSKENSLSSAARASRGMSRGALIEAILTEELIKEFPRELEEEKYHG